MHEAISPGRAIQPRSSSKRRRLQQTTYSRLSTKIVKNAKSRGHASCNEARSEFAGSDNSTKIVGQASKTASRRGGVAASSLSTIPRRSFQPRISWNQTPNRRPLLPPLSVSRREGSMPSDKAVYNTTNARRAQRRYIYTICARPL